MAILITTRITEVENLITALNTAILATIQGNHQSYELDTGQGSQGVKRFTLKQMQDMRRNLYIELDELNTIAGNNNSVVTVLPE